MWAASQHDAHGQIQAFNQTNCMARNKLDMCAKFMSTDYE